MQITDLTSRYKGQGVRTRKESAITRIVIHHDAGQQPSAVEKVLPRFDAYNRQHDHDGGFPYHYAVDPWGTIYKCRLTTEITSHVRDNNTPSLAVMLMGYFHKDASFKGEKPTPAQLAALRTIVPGLAAALPSVKFLMPHKDVPGSRTVCPGNLFPYAEIDKLRAKLGLTAG